MKRIQFSNLEFLGLLLLALCLVFQLIYRSIQNNRLNAQLQKISLSLDYPEGVSVNKDRFKKDMKNSNLKYKPQIERFAFDPNTLPLDSLQLLGLPYSTAKNLIKYREHGGSFYNKEDLRKIYGMEDSIFKRLEPFIQTRHQNIEAVASYRSPKPIKTEEYPTKVNRKKFTGPIYLNATDSTQLDSLPGIGQVLSKRILKYRQALGGFHQQEQLKEVYGITDSVYQNIKAYLELEKGMCEKIMINEIDFKHLLKHPYCDYDMTRKIINYRKQHGPYKDVSDLASIYGIDTLALKKLSFYLNFQIPKESRKDPE